MLACRVAGPAASVRGAQLTGLPQSRTEPLVPAEREQRALAVLGLTAEYDQPELPLQVAWVAEYNRRRQNEIDERRTMRIPAEDHEQADLGEAWTALAARRRDAVIQPPKPPIPAADEIVELAAERDVEREAG